MASIAASDRPANPACLHKPAQTCPFKRFNVNAQKERFSEASVPMLTTPIQSDRKRNLYIDNVRHGHPIPVPTKACPRD